MVLESEPFLLTSATTGCYLLKYPISSEDSRKREEGSGASWGKVGVVSVEVVKGNELGDK